MYHAKVELQDTMKGKVFVNNVPLFVSLVKTVHHSRRQTQLTSLSLSLLMEPSRMLEIPLNIGITKVSRPLPSSHNTDQRMEAQPFKFGESISSILEMNVLALSV